MINIALLKEQLKRFWGLSALLFTWFAFTIVLPLYNSWSPSRALAELLTMRNVSMAFAVLFAPLIAVIVLFSFQNHAKSVTSMYSYPLTRIQFLATNALAGMILLTLPLLFFSIIMIFPLHQFYYILFISTSSPNVPSSIVPTNPHHGEMLNSALVMSGFFFRVTLSMLFYLAWYIVATTLSGNSIITILLCISLPLLPILLPILAMAIFNFYVFGFYIDVLLYNFPFYIHPVLFFEGLRDSDGALFLRIVSYIAIIIALSILSVFTTNRRAHERSGDSVVFPYVNNALIFFLSICGLILMGLLFLNMFNEVLAMYVGFAIGFFIAYCLAQMIAEKTFNIISKMKDFVKFGSVAVGLLILILLSSSLDIFGYERHVPHPTDIAGVQMTSMRVFEEPTLDELFVKDISIINETTALHQTIINERNTIRHFGLFESLRYVRNLSILYKLNNGNLITRTYSLPGSFMTSNSVPDLQTRSRYSVSLLFDRPDLISRIVLDFQDMQDIIIAGNHVLEFMDAFMKDLENDLIMNEGFWGGIQGNFHFSGEMRGHNQYWLRRISTFRVESTDQSYIYKWLIANGYI